MVLFKHITTLTLFLLFCLGAWWEVDLGEGVVVSRVTIFNRNDGDAAHAALISKRLSNSRVSLLNYQDTTLRSYYIGDATNRFILDINLVSYRGCYIDLGNPGVRDLPYLAATNLPLNSKTVCMQLCTEAGYKYAGTQFSMECFCGNSYGSYGVDLNGCNMPCAGNAGETCGGGSRNSVYTTLASGVI